MQICLINSTLTVMLLKRNISLEKSAKILNSFLVCGTGWFDQESLLPEGTNKIPGFRTELIGKNRASQCLDRKFIMT